ncbi:MAG: PhoH family protein [Planctomycetes bacterium]|nr:PhoH family protein [Planctomycetota bacterium]NOG54377.1 PhoH family protein [Planctomycetota bacterium]
MEKNIPLAPDVDRTAVLGSTDRNLKLIREALGVRISARDGMIRLAGEPEQVNKAEAVLELLTRTARRKRTLSRDEVLEAIVSSPDCPAHDDTLEASDVPAWQGDLKVYASGRPVRPKTANQEHYVEAIRTTDLVFGIGPAGTGKTYLSVAAAVNMLKIGRVKRLVLARPAVEAGERLGFLPGDMHQKVNPYLRPLFDALEDMLDYQTLQRFIANDVVEVVPLAFMRGRTLNDAVIILDEAQNTTANQMLMFLTRMGRRSKCIVTGDVTQIDLDDPRTSGLVDAARRLRRVQGVSFVTLDNTDIVRHTLVTRVVQAYGGTVNRNTMLHDALFMPSAPSDSGSGADSDDVVQP